MIRPEASAAGRAFSCFSCWCSPTPSCSLNRERFERPPPLADAGNGACELDEDDDLDEQTDEGPRCAATDVALGDRHTCGLSMAGELFCWGDDRRAQLGRSVLGADAGTELGLRFALDDGVAVAAGGSHSCALDRRRRVRCWGDNRAGQLDGQPSDGQATPTLALDLPAAAVTAGGAHSCAIVPDEGIYCWGAADHGQAGRTVQTAPLPPGPVPDTEHAVEVTAGARHTCARFEGGAVRCWGELIGDAGKRVTAEPTPVAGLEDAYVLAAGAGFTCALRRDGAVACWGQNGSGQLGDGTFEDRATPVTVQGLELSLGIAAGGAELDGKLVGHACAVTRSFLVQCWGRNREGQLGRSEPQDVSRATVVQNEVDDDDPFLDRIQAVGVGGFHSCAVEEDGEVMCWGDDRRGQLGARDPVRFGFPVETGPFRGQF